MKIWDAETIILFLELKLLKPSLIKRLLPLHNDCDIIINTTPCGMYPNTDCLPIHLHNFKKLEAVVDVIYNPLRTKFIVKAQNRKISAIGGLYMLVAQAFYASRLFQDKNLNEEQIDCIYHHLVLEKENIVLIGMPSSGKTTIGSMLAKRLHKEFIDTDELIKSRIQMEISEYFSKFGENSFRIVESQVIEEVSKRTNLVIATGGGVILKRGKY
ncbi:MAG: shikimate kinase [Christensenellales bacterium]